ncbi:MAG: hypothetical protein ABFR47_08835, partial [Verrucomicrobiota bacterium]
MSWIDWLIALSPLVIVAAVGLYAQRFVKGVSDFLAAGRVAGRYVVAVASGEAAMGLISIIALFEVYYNSGLAYNFWNTISAPVGMIVLLLGFCVYRYRETRAMTMGQFLEMRYNRAFRIYAGILQATSGVLNYAIFPAVGARFLVYYCDLPLVLSLGGWEIPTFMLVMAIFLSVAVFVATIGGQITIMATDCIQGILSYPLYAIIVIYLLSRFSWFGDIVPAVMDRPEGKSFLNPFDIGKLRDFNLFYVMVGIFASFILNRMAWSGSQGYNAAAKDAHEQKMGGVLGVWRYGFSSMMYILLALCAYVFLNGGHFTKEAAECRSTLAVKAMADTTRALPDTIVRDEFVSFVETGEKSETFNRYISVAEATDQARKEEVQASKIRWGLEKEEAAPATDISVATAEPEKADPEAILGVGVKALKGYGEETGTVVSSQAFKTIFGQMRVPMALKAILPVGIAGVFCALCVFLLLSTDTTYLHSWGGIIVQDVVLPIRGKPLTPHQHLKLLRIIIALVALFAFLFSSFFAQIDFILMFFVITGMIWMGGAGSCIVGGLYWKRGTTAGAFFALTAGSVLAVSGIVAQKTWETGIYPWLEARELVGTVAVWLEKLSAPFGDFIVWEMSPTKFPINSQEMYFFTMLTTVLGYIIVSLLTCKEPFNMDRLLHRGKYRREGEELLREKLTFRKALNKVIGITSEYTKGDRILARTVFGYSFGWAFGSFLVILIWNKISPWPDEWWGVWYFIPTVVVAGVIGTVSTVWFTWGGTRDLIRMFRDLKAKDSSILDDGRVVGHVSADDVELVETVDHTTIKEAHVEEHELEEALEKEREKGR